MFDKKNLKQGDFVICECESTQFFFFFRFYELDYRENIYGAPHFTATLGGFKGKEELVVTNNGWRSCWWSIKRKATEEEIAKIELAIKEKGYTFDGKFYHKPEKEFESHRNLEEEIAHIIECEEKYMRFQFKNQLISYIARHFAKWQRNHVWHNVSEEPNFDKDSDIVILIGNEEIHTHFVFQQKDWEWVKKRHESLSCWAYLKDLLPDKIDVPQGEEKNRS